MKHRGRDPKQALIEQELLSWFENEVVVEELEGYHLTRVELSVDRAHLTLWYLPPEVDESADHVDSAAGDSGDEEALAALESLRWDVGERVGEILRKRPEIRWREDRGAQNKRRVESILEELREQRGEDG